MLREIHLHGSLGQQFGRHFRLAVSSPAEAVRALTSQLKGFRQAIERGEWHVIVSRGTRASREDLDQQTVAWKLGDMRHVHIVPAAAGAKNSGATKIIIGVVLIVAAIFTYGAAIGWFGGGVAGAMGSTSMATAAGTTAGSLTTTAWAASATVTSFATKAALFGASLIFAGISQLLAPQPKGPVDQKQSFLFSGPQNTFGQGQVVPLIYGGPIRVGSIVAAASLKAEEYAVSSTAQTAITSQPGVLYTSFWRSGAPA